jgi:predicted nuclease with RNAse H fold
LRALARKVRPQLITIDAPLSLPPGRKDIHDRNGEHYRPCDRELLARGIRFFPITLGGMRKLTERGMWLKAAMEADGFSVVEGFPGGAQDVLGLPRKQHDLEGLRDGLRRLGLKGIRDDATHDELDAVTAAYTGRLLLRGEAEVLGNGEVGKLGNWDTGSCEGIVMPKFPHEFLDGLRLYWRGYYWHSHEHWEDLWRTSSEPQRSFLQALIQIDAALIHSERGDWNGVRNLLTRVLRYLSNCPDKMLGVDVPALRRQVEKFRAEADALLRQCKTTFNHRVKPRLAPDGLALPRRERLRRAADDLPER